MHIRRQLSPRPSVSAGDDGAYAAIDAFIEEEMARLRIPAVAMAIVEGEHIAHFRGFGRARPDGGPPTLQTPFFIGSLAKSITALAVMQLVEAGRVELDAPVQRYLPWFRTADAQASAAISVRHLLNQTSGLPPWTGDAPLADFDARPDAGERQARALASVELDHRPGEKCAYNNMHYNLLGLIIEAAGGRPYQAYVQEHILDPLGMDHTYFSRAAAQENGLAMGHRYWFGYPVPTPELPSPHGSLASGQLISTAGNLARWLAVHLDGGRSGESRILSAAGFDELHRGALEYGRFGVSAGKYAMGWFEDQVGETEVIWHSGTVPDFCGHMALLPAQNKGIVLLFNGGHWFYNPILAEMGGAATTLLAGEKPARIAAVRLFPWLLRSQAIIPAGQMAGVLATLGLLRRWRLNPERRPSGGSELARLLLLPLIPDGLVALLLKPFGGRLRGYLKLFMPDTALLAAVCGRFAVVWAIFRTGLVLGALAGRRRDHE
jgi:CubicO group peptidase (beta-lactamase class C family)